MLREANDDRLKAVIFGFSQGEGHPGEDAGGQASYQPAEGASPLVSPNFSAISSTKFVTWVA